MKAFPIGNNSKWQAGGLWHATNKQARNKPAANWRQHTQSAGNALLRSILAYLMCAKKNVGKQNEGISQC